MTKASLAAPWYRLALVSAVALVLVAGSASIQAEASEDPSDTNSSVVKLYVRSNAPDPLSPWQKQGTRSSSGSGVIIDGQRILTNAHVVDDYVSLEVKRAGKTRRYPAEVSHFGHACDLALVTVSDLRFFEGAEPLQLGGLPTSQAEVEVYGFPIGGDMISVTSGIVSRIERSTYAHSLDSLLLAQIDAAINAGNSGGPVVQAGRIVGLAVQSLDDAENVGYMIPAPVIRHFLDDVADGRFDGFPRLGVWAQHLESDTQRSYLGMREEETGALVTRVNFGTAAWGVLRPGDVLLSVDGTAIANDLTIEWPGIGRVHFAHLYQSRQVGERVSLSILREGQRLEEIVALGASENLVPGRRRRPIPTHLVFGGLVFRPLTSEYLLLWKEPPFDLGNYAWTQNLKTAQRQQLIVLSQVLPNVVNRGYQDVEDLIVKTVDGEAPRDMRHLARLIDAAEGPWLTLRAEDGSIVTIDVAASREGEARILADYGLQRDRSPDLASGESELAMQRSVGP